MCCARNKISFFFSVFFTDNELKKDSFLRASSWTIGYNKLKKINREREIIIIYSLLLQHWFDDWCVNALWVILFHTCVYLMVLYAVLLTALEVVSRIVNCIMNYEWSSLTSLFSSEFFFFVSQGNIKRLEHAYLMIIICIPYIVKKIFNF